MYAIEVKNISKRFREKGRFFYALKDIDLEIERGEIFGLLGPNGAGKTTLLNIIIGILSPDKGYVKVFGEGVLENRGILEKMNFVSGETRFHWYLKAKNILNYYAMSYGLLKRKRERRIRELAEFFGIEGILNRKFDSLSSGERMRLVFVKALLNEPKLILFDEPTLGLDPSMAIKVRKEIKKINKTLGTTILLTSHYMNEVEQLSDRVAFINRGKIIDIGTVEKVKLKKFSTYDLIIEVGEVKDRDFLRKSGFRISGRKLKRTLNYDDDLSEILSILSNKGYKIVGVETKKPTLEDYFVKILGEKR